MANEPDEVIYAGKEGIQRLYTIIKDQIPVVDYYEFDPDHPENGAELVTSVTK